MNLDAYRTRVAVTGGAGFIGSNLLLYLVPLYSEYLFVNIDCLTYAANLANLSSIESRDNYRFEKVDVRNAAELAACFDKYRINAVIHLAAETHVDRSIDGPAEFIQTNIVGTFNLLERAVSVAKENPGFRFHHVSTDEVYGSLGETGTFSEQSPFGPNSPYAASKAAADHLVRSYHKTYGLNTVTTNCSNNFGSFQFPEKLIPLMIRNATERQPLPVFGDGLNVRDWLYVEDHCRAIDVVFHKGEAGRTYNVGGGNEVTNIDLVKSICRIMDQMLDGDRHEELIRFVEDRPGHDRRYAIDSSRIRDELGWQPKYSFEAALRATVEWYLDNDTWLESCISGDYRKYYERMYAYRLSGEK